ncbi:hypothetical protein M3Y99_01223100 [Aphelenchoides fujianensis]|nr:hypothetical protein M3Y99_01223100 [Aphelenchoides fujianensis]
MENRRAEKLKAEQEAKEAREAAERASKQKIEDARKLKEQEAQQKKEAAAKKAEDDRLAAEEKKAKDLAEKMAADQRKKDELAAKKQAELDSKKGKPIEKKEAAPSDAAPTEEEVPKKLGKKDIKQLPPAEAEGLSEAQKRQEELKRKREEAARQKEEAERLRKEEEEARRLKEQADRDAQLSKAQQDAADALAKEKDSKSSAQSDLEKRRAEMERRKAAKLKAEEDARKAREESDRLAREKADEKRRAKEAADAEKLAASKRKPSDASKDKPADEKKKSKKDEPKDVAPTADSLEKTKKPATSKSAAQDVPSSEEETPKKLGKKDIKQLPAPEAEGLSEAQKRQEELKRKREEAARLKEEEERKRKEEEEARRLREKEAKDADLLKAQQDAADAAEREKSAKSSAADEIAKRRAEMERRKAEKLQAEEDARKAREEADRLAREKLEEKRRAKELEAQQKNAAAGKKKPDAPKETPETTAVDSAEKVSTKAEKSLTAADAEAVAAEEAKKLRKPKTQVPDEAKPPQDEATRRLEELRKKREEAARQKEEADRLKKEEEEQRRLKAKEEKDAALLKAQQDAADAAERERQSKLAAAAAHDEDERKRADAERQLEERLKAMAEKNKQQVAAETSGTKDGAAAGLPPSGEPKADSADVSKEQEGIKKKKVIKKRRPRPEALTDETTGEVRWQKDDGTKPPDGEAKADEMAEEMSEDRSSIAESESEDESGRRRLVTKALSFEEETLDDISEYLKKRAARAVETEAAPEPYVRAIRHRQKRAGFVTPPEHTIYALRGDRVVIECELFNEEDEVEWSWNDANIDRDPRCSLEDYGYIRRLVIKDIVPADSGSVATVQLANDILSTTVMVDETPVEFVRKLERRTTAIAGEVTVLNVELSHNAEQVRWFFNGQQITAETPGYRLVSDGIVQALQILKPAYELEGRYAVQADQSETSTVLEVEGKPVVADGTKTIELDAHETMTCRLPVRSNPEPDVALFLNGESLFADIRTTIEISDDLIIVSRKGLRKADAGVYQLKITNEHGESAQEVKVVVNDTPEAPLRLVVTEVGHDFATVAWDKPSHDGGSIITGYIVEKKDVNRRVFQRVGQVSGHKNNLFVEELDMETNYQFRVAAFNRFGIGEYSDTVVVSTGIPFVAPSMYTSPIVSQSCYLEWEMCTESGGSPIYSYDVFMREEGADWVRVNRDPCFTTSFWIHDQLKPGAVYQFKVEASNEAGLTSNSNVASESILVPKSFDVPSAELPLPSVKVASMDTAEVSWEVPAEYQSKDISYKVYFKSEGNAVWNEITTKKTSVQIDDLKEGVAYVFKVAAENEAGMGKSSGETEPTVISAYQRPTITKPIRSIVVPRKRELRLDCHALGEPAPIYSWFKDGRELGVADDDNISISNEGFMSVLTIHETDGNDAGTYEVHVSNVHGVDKSRAEVTVGDVRAHFLRSFPEHLQLTEQKTLELECELSDEEAVVQWFKNEKPLRETERVRIERSGPLRRLVITGVLAEDSGTYMCQTSDERSYTRSRVAVKEEVAHIHLGPQDQVITGFNEKVVLRCELTRPVAAATWFKNGLQVNELSGKHFAINDEHLLTLEIMNFDEKDVGDYVVELQSGERSAPAHIRLQIPPRLELSREVRADRELVAYVGSELTFTIRMEGFPTPRFEALLNSETLRHFASIDDFDESNIHVRIAPVSAAHTGQVSLRATNECGEDVRKFTIRVVDVPAAPRNVNVEVLSGTAVEISWDPSPESPDAPVDHYIVERKTAEHSRWRQSAKIRPQHPLRTIVDELFSDEIYVFRVVAVNDVGKGHPSKSVDIVTPADDDEDLSIMSNPSLSLGVDRAVPEQPKRPRLEIVNKRAELQWEPVENCTEYAVERKRAGPDEMWLEIAITDRTTFIDRSVFASGTYAYRIVAKFLKTRSTPSEATAEVHVEAQALRRSSSTSSVLAGRPDSPASDEQSSASTLRSRDDSGIGNVDSSEDASRADATKTADEKPAAKKRVVKKKTTSRTEEEPTGAAAKPPKPQAAASSAPLELTQPMRDVEVGLGAEARFSCTFADLPFTASVNWSKDGTRIGNANGRKFKSALANGEASLVISGVAVEDAGVYKCEVVDSERRGESSARLTVRAPQPTEKTELPVGTDAPATDEKPPKSAEAPKKKRLVKKRTTSDLSEKGGETDRPEGTSSPTEPSQISPQFEMQLTDTTVKVGNDVVLDCRVVAKPNARVQWFHDGKKMRMDSRHLEYTDRSGIIRLNLIDCRSEDGGLIECEATNGVGSDRTRCLLTVEDTGGGPKQWGRRAQGVDDEDKEKTPTPKQEQDQKNGQRPSADASKQDVAPHFSYELKDKAVVLGEDTSFKCRIEANPTPHVEWLKNEQPLTKSKRLRFSQNENVYALKIGRAVAEDTGAYSVIASNRAGRSRSDGFLTVAAACGADGHLVGVAVESTRRATSDAAGEVPKFTRKPPAELRVSEGTPIELRGHAVGGGGALTMKWLKDGREIARTNKAYRIRVAAGGEHVLEIECALQRTAGVFTLVASNSEGEARADTRIEVSGRKVLSAPTETFAPRFVDPLKDQYVPLGKPVALGCSFESSPEATIEWFFVDDNQASTPLALLRNVWTEYRPTATSAEIRSVAAVRTQQGTYQAVATNKIGRAITSSYLTVGEGANRLGHAGPPRFTKCLRDCWTALGESVVFDIDVLGTPTPEIVWYFNDQRIEAGDAKRKITIPLPGTYRLEIADVRMSDLGAYAVEAHNQHGLVRTSGLLTIGDPFDPQSSVGPPGIEIQDVEMESELGSTVGDAFGPQDDDHVLVGGAHRIKRKGAAPAFVIGLHDMELKAGQTAAVAGKMQPKKRKHRLFERNHDEDPKHLRDSLVTPVDDDDQRTNSGGSHGGHSGGNTTMDEIRHAIAARNQKLVAPKFHVKPKPRKEIEEHKSLRLKTAISANPPPEVKWDKDGVILETGNKYSIFNDGEFFNLTVHHVSAFDQGFYNCTAVNSKGFATCTSEVVVRALPDTPLENLKKRIRRDPIAPSFIDVLPARMTATVGQELTVECSISGYPTPAISWQRNGATLLPQPDRYSIFFDGESTTLKLASITMADAGVYTAVVENSMGRVMAQMHLEVARPDVNERDAQKPVFVETRQKYRKVMDGRPLEIEADLIEGTEPIAITWLHDNLPVGDSAAFRYKRAGKSACLVIADPFPEDSGEYTCVAESKFGRATAQIDLTVVEQAKSPLLATRPQLTPLRPLVRAEPHATVELGFRVAAKPEAVISWFRGDAQLLPDSLKHEMVNRTPEFLLRIHNVTSEDAGDYRLLAMNNAGQSSESVRLEVSSGLAVDNTANVDPPHFTKLPVAVQCARGQAAELRCEFDGTPAPHVQWFRGADRVFSGDDFDVQQPTATSALLRIAAVDERTQGEYVCAIRNAGGEELASARVLLEAAAPLLRSFVDRGRRVLLLALVERCAVEWIVWAASSSSSLSVRSLTVRCRNVHSPTPVETK